MRSTDPYVLLASVAVTFPVMSQRLKLEFPRDIHDSKFASIGRSLLPWPEVNANEAMIRNLSTLENIAESVAKAITLLNKNS